MVGHRHIDLAGLGLVELHTAVEEGRHTAVAAEGVRHRIAAVLEVAGHPVKIKVSISSFKQ